METPINFRQKDESPRYSRAVEWLLRVVALAMLRALIAISRIAGALHPDLAGALAATIHSLRLSLNNRFAVAVGKQIADEIVEESERRWNNIPY